jgi:hypothetical protein
MKLSKTMGYALLILGGILYLIQSVAVISTYFRDDSRIFEQMSGWIERSSPLLTLICRSGFMLSLVASTCLGIILLLSPIIRKPMDMKKVIIIEGSYAFLFLIFLSLVESNVSWTAILNVILYRSIAFYGAYLTTSIDTRGVINSSSG